MHDYLSDSVHTVHSDEYQYVCVLSDDSVINSSTVQCASEIVTSDDDTRGMQYYTH